MPSSTGNPGGRLVREAEGNPLYLEELARALVDGGLTPRGRTWTITLRSAESLPPALENLLVARIDRLPNDARRLTHIAAVIGRTFPVRALQEVAEENVGAALATLLRDELVEEVGRYPEPECMFVHVLVQEAALSTLTAARRRFSTHASPKPSSRSTPSRSTSTSSGLAHHHAQAGNLPRALEYAERAKVLA